MASLLKSLFLTSLLVLAISSPNVLARESQAFSRFVRPETPAEPDNVIPEESPAVQVAKAAKLAAAAAAANNNKQASRYNTNGDGARYNPDAFPSRFSNNEWYSKDANYDKMGFADENHGGYSYSTIGGGYTKKESPMTHYPDNYAHNEVYGMSDTRTLEGGKYRYDVDSGKGYGAYAGIGVDANYRHTPPNSGGNNQEGLGEEYVP